MSDILCVRMREEKREKERRESKKDIKERKGMRVRFHRGASPLKIISMCVNKELI